MRHQWRDTTTAKISLGTATWIAVIVILVLFEILQVTGILKVTQIVANFYLFMFSVVVVSVLAVIGAIFLGISLAHRLMESKEFTPFEEEMLSMKEQINGIEKKLESLLESMDRGK